MSVIKIDRDLLNSCLKQKKISNSAASVKAGLSKPYVGGIFTQGTTHDAKFQKFIEAVFDEDDIEPWILNEKQACRFNKAVACDDISFVKCVNCGWCSSVAKERKEKARESVRRCRHSRP